MRAALAGYDSVMRDVVTKRHGFLFKHTGDGVAAAFAVASDAVDAAVDALERLTNLPFRIRVGLHTGEAQLRVGDYGWRRGWSRRTELAAGVVTRRGIPPIDARRVTVHHSRPGRRRVMGGRDIGVRTASVSGDRAMMSFARRPPTPVGPR
jgi:hypothetical protein